MPKYVTADGLYMRVGSKLYRWYIRNRMRILGKMPKPRPRYNLNRPVLRMAGHYVGVKEYPAGTNMQMFGRWYGENGVPWCAIFVSFVLTHCGRPFKYAYVPAIVADARAHKNGLKVIPASEVQTHLNHGRVVLNCYDWNGDGTADHVEFATRMRGGYVEALGGNTGPADWSNGGEVARETRSVVLVQAFVLVGR